MAKGLQKGQRFGRLTVIEGGHYLESGLYAYLCLCDCGEYTTLRSCTLTTGNTTSCGCKIHEHPGRTSEQQTTHGMSQSRTYTIWRAMRSRCYNPNNGGYKYYGAKGILVCDRWKDSFENFLEDMGECPDGMELDRILSIEGYHKANCRWTTHQDNMKNMHDTAVGAISITLKGLTAEQFDILIDSIGRIA